MLDENIIIKSNLELGRLKKNVPVKLISEENSAEPTWIDACDLNDIVPNSGVCALLKKQQVAIFYLHPERIVKAISNFDPIAGANVLARGIVAEVEGRRVVSSPLYKQHFCLDSGICLQDETCQISTHESRIENGKVQILIESLPEGKEQL